MNTSSERSSSLRGPPLEWPGFHTKIVRISECSCMFIPRFIHGNHSSQDDPSPWESRNPYHYPIPLNTVWLIGILWYSYSGLVPIDELVRQLPISPFHHQSTMTGIDNVHGCRRPCLVLWRHIMLRDASIWILDHDRSSRSSLQDTSAGSRECGNCHK